MAFLVSTFVVFVVNERSMKAKHAQFMTGIGATNFWLSSFLWDALCYLIPSVIIIIIVLAFQTSAYSTKDLIG
jgi:ATP-binding cassette subfamily A (ABC1) protein 3